MFFPVIKIIFDYILSNNLNYDFSDSNLILFLCEKNDDFNTVEFVQEDGWKKI